MAKSEKNFKKTEYGKKLVRMVMIWNIIFFISFLAEVVISCLIPELEPIIYFISIIPFGISIYMDGKYKGACEMYNKRMN